MDIKNNNLLKKTCYAVLTALAISSPAKAFAQQQTTTAEADEVEFEKIVVTSRGRKETLQQIPDSVTVIKQAEIEQAGISSIKDFSTITPNLDVSTNFRSGLNFVTVRGLITPQVGEAPLAYVVDGITVPNLEFINQGLQDIERIEVLRGPQGALYGKNAIGGAVNIVTVEPDEEVSGKLNVSYAEGNDLKLSGTVSGGVDDTVYYRLSGTYQDADGLIDNPYLGREVDYIDGAISLQGKVQFYIGDDSSLTLLANYSDKEQGSNYMAFIDVDQLENFDIKPDSNALGLDDSELWSLSAKFEHEMDLGELTIVASTSSADILFFSDGDFTHEGEVERNFFFPITQINPITEDANTIEARLTSADDGRFRWVVGAYAETKDRSVSFDQVWDTTPTELVTYNDVKQIMAKNPELVFTGEKTQQESSAYALFAQSNYDINDDLELSLALRYDSETREAYDSRDRAASAAEETFDELQPKASLAWQVTDDILLFSTYSKGFRSGGFNEWAPTVNRKYDKEISDTIEVGMKNTLMDGKVWLNLAAFNIEQENAQFTRLNPTTFTLENLNIDEVSIYGLELEMSAKLNEQFTAAFGAGYIDSEITKNVGTDILSGRNLAETQGNTMPYVSDFNVNGSLTHNIEVMSGWSLNTRVAFNTVGPRSFDIFNADTGESDTHTFFNLNIMLESEQWAYSLFIDNLTDEAAPETVFLFNPLIRMPNRPRQAGVKVSYKF